MNDNKHSKLKRKIATYTLIFVLAGAAVRIAYVNITAEKPIIEYYSENEWAGLNGSYTKAISFASGERDISVAPLRLIWRMRSLSFLSVTMEI